MNKLYLTILCCICIVAAHAQNVGIGTSNPTRAKLEVPGVFQGGATAALFGSGTMGISFQRNWPTIGFNQYRDDITPGSQGKYMANGFAAIHYMDPGSGTLAFDMFATGTANNYTPTGIRGITIFNNGHTSIRTGSSNASLSVGRGNGEWGTAVFKGLHYSSHFSYSIGEDTYIRSGKANGSVVINDIPNGNVILGTYASHLGINSTNPFFTIEIYQPPGEKAMTFVDNYNYRWSWVANFTNTQSNGNGVALDLYYNNGAKGRFQYWNGAYVVFSDEQLKTDIQPMEPVLSAIMKLQPKQYEMLRNNPKHLVSIGMVAQEVQPLFPGLVHQVIDHNWNETAINNALVMDYSGFSIMAIKALQEQEAEILLLMQQKEALMQRLLQLEKLMEKE